MPRRSTTTSRRRPRPAGSAVTGTSRRGPQASVRPGLEPLDRRWHLARDAHEIEGLYRAVRGMSIARQQSYVHSHNEAPLRVATERYFPAANGPTMALRTCLFTNTPDEHFVIAVHPAAEQVVVACGFSGHGFKFVPVAGEILADLATDGSTRHPIALFDPRRPALTG